MYTLAKSELFYPHQVSDEEICRMVDGVTALDIWRVAREIFGRDRWLIVALGNLNKSVLTKNFLVS
jgi:hypothetical protein